MAQSADAGSGAFEFSRETRSRNIDRMKAETFDLIVIGGGITGAGIAREAAMLGLNVALMEKEDFAAGTSSKSSKLVHGGLRYLKFLKFGLVYEASNERRILGSIAPHLVEPLLFVIPLYVGGVNSYVEMKAGMLLYDLLSRFRNIRTHRMVGAGEALLTERGIRKDQLRGAALYYDRRADDARLTLSTVRSAFRSGAVVANYVGVKGFIKSDGKVKGVHCLDRISGEELKSKGRVVVNATGPWVDHVRRLDDPLCDRKLRLTKGIHIVVPRSRLIHRNAVVLVALRDGRMIFAIPWGKHSIIGTTDTDYTGDLERVSATTDDISYLIESINAAFPEAELSQKDIISTYAGLRPLIDGQATSEYDVSRESQILESDSGLVTIAGGKLTTYRSMAEKLVDYVAKRIKREFGVSPRKKGDSESTPLDGGDIYDVNSFLEKVIKEAGETYDVDSEAARHLAEAYGTNYMKVLGFVGEDSKRAERLVADLPYIWAEVPYAVEYEMAITLSDFMIRRTHITYEDRNQGLDVMRDVATVMAEHLEWGPNEINEQVKTYKDQVELTRAFRR